MFKLFSYNDPMDDAIWINEVSAKITKNILRLSWHDLLSSNDEVREEAKNFFCSPLDEKTLSSGEKKVRELSESSKNVI